MELQDQNREKKIKQKNEHYALPSVEQEIMQEEKRIKIKRK